MIFASSSIMVEFTLRRILFGVLVFLSRQTLAENPEQCIRGDGTSVLSEPSDSKRGRGDEWANPLDLLKNSIFGYSGSEESDPFQGLEAGDDDKPDLLGTLKRIIKSQQLEENAKIEATTVMWEDLLLSNLKTSRRTLPEESLDLVLNRLKATFQNVTSQLQRTFDTIGLERFNLLQVWYAMLREESIKNSVWKRRQHRYLPALSEQKAMSLSDGLYLSQLSYVQSCDQVEQGLGDFHNFSWVLVNCTTIGQPLQPAHFVAVKRQPVDRTTATPWFFGDTESNRVLEVMVVIRGSKELGDLLSDGLLEPATYREGLAHDGIRQSALWIHSLYKDFFLDLNRMSKSSKLKLWLVGHSLGAGTAALASLEFNAQEGDAVEAHSLGFGTPAVVSRNLSESMQQSVTTVIHDADAVPRMSGATLANAWLRIVRYNWTDDALNDLEQLLSVIQENVPSFAADVILPDDVKMKILKWFTSFLVSQNSLPLVESPRFEPVLFPPGECVHIYRDGVQWQGNIIPCHRFSELEVVRHLIDDHLIPNGYYVGLLNFLRAIRKDWNWQFAHDLTKLPVQ